MAPPQCLATTTFIADIAQQISGNVIIVGSLLPVGSDPHVYEPVPNDARLVANAQMILMNGLTLEGWLDELIENSGTKATKVIVTRGIATISDPAHHNATDPHAWMSVANGMIYAKNIYEALVMRWIADGCCPGSASASEIKECDGMRPSFVGIG